MLNSAPNAGNPANANSDPVGAEDFTVSADGSPGTLHPVEVTVRRANPKGDLDLALRPKPVFRTRIPGYDRFEVENYLAWAESEIDAAQRANAHLAAQLGQCMAELREAEERAALATAGPDVAAVSDSIRRVMQLAVDEAAGLREVALAEADQLRALAIADAERLGAAAAAEAQHLRAEAADIAQTLLQQARDNADAIVAAASANRDQLDSQAEHDRNTLAEATEKRVAELDETSSARRAAAEAELAGRLAEARRELATLDTCRLEVLASCRSLERQLTSALGGSARGE
jgi:cell division septum initiation protein DivIVA